MRGLFVILLAVGIACFALALVPQAKACDGALGVSSCYVAPQAVYAAPLVQQYAVPQLQVQSYAYAAPLAVQSYGYAQQQVIVQQQRQFVHGGRQRVVNRQRVGGLGLRLNLGGRNAQRSRQVIRGGNVRSQAVIVGGY